ncbi:MAG: hypothetical protein RL172_2856 [Bacteroidota bacterium]|jgi:hypothetical protein
MHTGIKVIITGATGMVGEGVLHVCLQHTAIAEVLVVNRKPCGYQHAKLKEIIHADFYNLQPIANQLTGYDACFFCLGVSSVGLKEAAYFKLTHTLTLHVATLLSNVNKNMQFCYVSGAHTDSSEKGNIMWARVKGKTENDLHQLPFSKVYNFRPAIIKPTPGLKNTLQLYKYFGWLLAPVQWAAPRYICTLNEVALAMINAVTIGYSKDILEVSNIQQLAALSITN